MTMDITPRQAIRLAETKSGLSPIERQKMIALALPRIFTRVIEIKIAWEQIIMISEYPIPAFDIEFVNAINKNPSAFCEIK